LNPPQKMNRIRGYWPLLAAVLIFWVVLVAVLVVSLGANEGRLVYALDDTYIHMAIAKNFALHGVWGVTRHAFSSSSSSLLWTLLLSAAFGAAGIVEAVPLILNVVFATAVLVSVYVICRSNQLNASWCFTVLLAVIFFGSLPTVVFCGQEHALQILLSLVFAYVAAGELAGRVGGTRAYAILLVLAPLVTGIRYEGAFLIGVVAFLFAARGRMRRGLLLLGAGAFPLVVYGLVSVAKGWYFLPNSILLKGNVPHFDSQGGVTAFLRHGYETLLLKNPHMLMLVVGSLFLFLKDYDRERGLWVRSQLLLAIMVGTSLLHIQFARCGWFFRYEAYLVCLGIVAISISGFRRWRECRCRAWAELISFRGLAALILFFVVMSPFVVRAVVSLTKTPKAMHDRYLEHVLPALFFKEYYGDRVVVVNDIGAIGFYSDVRILDLFGLADCKRLRSPGGVLTADIVRDWAREEGAQIAYLQIQCSLIYPLVPAEWTKVGQWSIPRNVVFGDTRFGWYCVSPDHLPALTANLREYSKDLPKDITQSGIYLQR